jgi:hypothetical protein
MRVLQDPTQAIQTLARLGLGSGQGLQVPSGLGALAYTCERDRPPARPAKRCGPSSMP